MQRIILLLLLITFIGGSAHSQTSKLPNNYNVIWKSQSKNSFESMPLGGGDIGLNVWVENDELLFYVGQSGTFDENNQMLKHGRVRVSSEPNLFKDGVRFIQELKLNEGYILIKSQNAEGQIEFKLWVDVFKPVIHIEAVSEEPVTLHAQYESWRLQDVEIPLGLRHACFSYTSFPGTVITYKDSISTQKGSVQWFHRNKADKLLYDFIVEQQGLNDVKKQIPNTQLGRTFGGTLYGEGMVSNGTDTGKYISTDYKAWKIKSEKPQKKSHIKLALNTGQYGKLDEWYAALNNTIKEARLDKKAFQNTVDWWKNYWNKSYILLNHEQSNQEDTLWQVGRNYQLFRYMLGCNAYGEYPSKFNGSLFTVDPVFTRKKYDWTPDFRAWGGGSFTAQNQRLVYWPMLKSGDFDLMIPQFKYYTRALSAAEARTKVYWNHEGACFTEQLENFGLPFAGGWGFESGARKRNIDTEFGVQTNKHVSYHYVNQLEFSLMMLDYYEFTRKDISSYLPFIKSSLVFFDQHYQYRFNQKTGETLDKNDKLVIFPSTAAEMYKIAKNPSDIIAALTTILNRMEKLPKKYVSKEERAYYKGYKNRVPKIPFDTKKGNKVIKPAESWKHVANKEIPELYPVFPYGIYGVHKPDDIGVAINTFKYGESNEKRNFTECWSQVGIFAARLGLVEEAAHLVKDKLKDADNRFPAFWGPGPDWIPDVDHGGAGMINLQEMLVQTYGDSIFLLPAWPKDWDVKFKLHAPNQTCIEVELKDGKLVQLNVSPKKAKNRIRIPDWVN
ncbi:DUF5703 domain-containing protein [Flavivirga algicola]|uniref:DUF5703 domain-containing protein n=1 Tax=Flavivirga algicola TaxID=2729136 RepID=A0ABX1RZ10_9FLAO|nr:DUF5703 domain-containing protein [Flavivirga algicola]NMH88814.1 hypothetical protein [Flavivirga algicola]